MEGGGEGGGEEAPAPSGNSTTPERTSAGRCGRGGRAAAAAQANRAAAAAGAKPARLVRTSSSRSGSGSRPQSASVVGVGEASAMGGARQGEGEGRAGARREDHPCRGGAPSVERGQAVAAARTASPFRMESRLTASADVSELVNRTGPVSRQSKLDISSLRSRSATLPSAAATASASALRGVGNLPPRFAASIDDRPLLSAATPTQAVMLITAVAIGPTFAAKGVGGVDAHGGCRFQASSIMPSGGSLQLMKRWCQQRQLRRQGPRLGQRRRRRRSRTGSGGGGAGRAVARSPERCRHRHGRLCARPNCARGRWRVGGAPVLLPPRRATPATRPPYPPG